MNDVPQLGSTPFDLSAKERFQWGVRFSDDVLRLRSTGPRQAGAAGLVAAWAAFAVVAALSTAEPTVNIFFWSVHSRSAAVALSAVAVVAVTVVFLFGSVVATRNGIERRWLGVRRVSWDDVDAIEVVERVPPWMVFGPWFHVDVVEVSTRSGRRLKLWPIRSTTADGTGIDEPSAARIKRDLLQRYRESYAPVRTDPTP